MPEVVIGEPAIDKNAGTLAATDVTVPLPPVAAIVMEPLAFVTLTPEPAVIVVRVNPVPFPMSKAPFAGVVASPVPPLAIASVPVKFCAWTSKKFVPSDHTIILLPAAIAITAPLFYINAPVFRKIAYYLLKAKSNPKLKKKKKN